MKDSTAANLTLKPLPWWRQHGFLLGLLVAVILAFMFPKAGSSSGFLQADMLGNFGIALILFLQGLSLAFEKIISGAANWRLHLIIQMFTFVVFPIIGLGLDKIVPVIWESEPQAIREGFLYLCVLPSTISTSVVLTAVARGNTAGALFNAALSNILGVIITPVLVHLLMSKTGQSAPFAPLLFKIILLTLLPFTVGMALRPFIKDIVDKHKIWNARISNAIILFIVYAAFCESIEHDVWNRYGAMLTIQTLVWVIFIFISVSLLVHVSCWFLKLSREDKIAAYFCSVKKTLAMGIPLGLLIFGDRADLSLILLPIMFYHPLQLFVNGVLANQWAKQAR